MGTSQSQQPPLGGVVQLVDIVDDLVIAPPKQRQFFGVSWRDRKGHSQPLKRAKNTGQSKLNLLAHGGS